MTPDEFRRSRRGTDYGHNTVWYDHLVRDFSYDNNQYLSINGSTRDGHYGASFNYKKATGIDIISEREEYAGRFVLEQRMLNNRLQLNGSLSMLVALTRYGQHRHVRHCSQYESTMPIYNEDGTCTSLPLPPVLATQSRR